MNAPTLFTHRQRHDHKLRAAELALVQAMQTVSGLALNLRDGDLDRATGTLDRADVLAAVRAFEARLLAWREEVAATARIPETEDVSDADGFECGLLAALDRHFGTAPDGPRLGPSDCLEPGYATGAGRR